MMVADSVASFGVELLLDKVLKAAKLYRDANKNVEVLYSTLTLLDPLVTDICKSREPMDSTRLWLQELRKELLRADKLVQGFKNSSRVNLLKRIKTSKETIEVVERLKDLCVLAPVAAYAMNQRLLDEINRGVSELKNGVGDLQFAQVTKMALNTRTGNSGSYVNTMSSSQAITTIRSQASEERARRANDGVSGNESTGDHELSASEPVNSTSQQRYAWRSMMGDFIVGDDKYVKDVTELLFRQSEKSDWVGVWSMGGAGKTLTARRVYEDREVRSHFLGGTFWLDVGRDRGPLSLLCQLYTLITGQSKDYSSEDIAKDAVMSKLRSIRDPVLLVLDDVWSQEGQDILSLLDVVSGSFDSPSIAAPGSKTLVTTRDRTILTKVHAENIQIGMLSEEHSWELFCWHAFRGEENVSPSLNRYAREVTKECNGLPLALKVIGATMAGKNDPKQWELDLRRLKHAYTLSKEHEHQVYHKLQLSLDDLPAVDERLTDCFYYFAAFPEDQRITLFDLLGVWVADLESIASGDANGLESAEDVAYRLLGHLIERSLIELRTGNPKVYHEQERLMYKIHDVLRDLIRHNLQHQREPHEMLCLYQAGMQKRQFPKEWLNSSHLRAERMSLMYNGIAELPSERLQAHRLRVLLLGNNRRLGALPKHFFANLSELRVLDLKNTALQEIPSAVFEGLKNLKLLDLSHCKIRNIPDSIKLLRSLTELHLSYCGELQELPDAVKYLRKLTALHLPGCKLLRAIPGCVRSMTNLKTLDTYDANADLWEHEPRGVFKILQHKPLTLQDLGCLTALENLHVYSLTATSFPVDFEKMKQLTHLRVYFSMLQSFPDPSKLTELDSLMLLSWQMKNLPEGIVSLGQLTRLDLGNCMALTSLPALDELQLLKYLQLGQCRSLTHLPESFGLPGAFPSLEELDMTGCTKAILPTLHLGTMPQLLVLRLVSWEQLETLPESLRVLTSLSCLRLSLCGRLATLEPAFTDANSFPHLEELFLSDTRVARLPEEFFASKPKLTKLDLRGTPLQANFLPQVYTGQSRKLEILTSK